MTTRIRSQKFEFQNAAGETLAGNLERPLGTPRAFALFAHCFTCSKDILAASRISRALAARGFATLRFDFTGLGSSGGDFANTSFSSNVDDLVRAAAALRGAYAAPRLLVGHSLGGAAVLAAARRIEEVDAVATIGAPADPAHVRRLLAGATDEIERSGRAAVSIAGRSFEIGREFLEDLGEARLGDALGALGKALLVMHAPLDDVVGIENAERIYRAARGYKSFVSLGDADHLLSRRADAEYAADVLAAWATRYVDGPAVDAAEPAEGDVLVEELERPYTNRVVAREHEWLADEPRRVGGLDAGPTPYELLLAGLGACTSMTLRMFADRKGWPLERVAVHLRHEKVHAEDCATCGAGEAGGGRIDRLTREIELVGPALDEAQRARLLEIAERCPVHRTLLEEKEIVTVERPGA